MGNRLSAIATRTGDDGTTGLGDGTRVPKDTQRVHAMGDVDELNSHIGVLRALNTIHAGAVPADIDALLSDIQHDLFDMGGELCIPGYVMVTDAHVARLDTALAHYNAALPKLEEFILPGGKPAAAQAHICRTVARRAERTVVTLGQQAGANLAAPPRLYLNRLSDLMFVLARVLNRVGGGANAGDVLWIQRKNAGH
jgi:cob(I)alamin adenosyltransferase